MTTTCTDIVNRARAFSALNQGLTGDSVEMLSRIKADQQRVFTGVAGITRDRFKTTAALTSSGGASVRVFTLSAVTPPIERVLLVTLGDGRIVNPVDELDPEAELAPRYFVRGQTLIEVGNDWGSSGAKTATLVYVYGATAITPTGSLSQTVTIPDEFIDVLVLPLAGYLHQKDPGRDPAEYERLVMALDDAQQTFVGYLTNYGGIVSERFVLPNPLRQKASK